MNMALAEPDWALWRSFSAVVAEGSLSAAARAIGYSQPTLGRHIETLEQQLNVTLFDRTLQGLRPTPTALRLYEEVGKAQIALSNAVMVAEGTAGALEGTVRITASTIVSHYLLPPILHDIRDTYPRIALDLVPTDSIENLLLRESDIAVRMMRPTQLELVARKIGDLPIVCCAHQSYIDEHGAPQRPEDLLKHTLIGFDRSDLLINGARALGFEIKRSDFAVRTDSQTAYWEMLKTGIGIGFAQLGLVRATSGMRELLHGLRPPPLEAWLATHRELFLSPRIRAIYDRLAAGLEAHIKGLSS
jgi:DNA-binding transcriptional LysR family regulator